MTAEGEELGDTQVVTSGRRYEYGNTYITNIFPLYTFASETKYMR